MSLTSLREESGSGLRRWFAERLPHTRNLVTAVNRNVGRHTLVRGHALAAADRDNRGLSGLSGTAIDYRLRYYFGIQSFDGRAADKGADHSAVPTELRDAFFSALQDTLDELRPVGRRLDDVAEERLVRFCVVLGLLEQPFRASVSTPIMDGVRNDILATVADLLAIPTKATVDDVTEMSRAFFEQQYESLDREPIVLNPTFSGSRDIGSADADMITGGLLVDFKSSATAGPLSRLILYQLIGYACLDYDDEWKIESVGVSFVRRGVLVEWPIDDLLHRLSGGKYDLPRLRGEFVERLVGAEARTQRRDDDARARAVGFRSYAEYQRIAESAEYRRVVERIARVTGASIEQLRLLDSPFNRQVAKSGGVRKLFGAPRDVSKDVARADIDEGGVLDDRKN